MPRWPADAAQRLAHAALDLFVEKGYDETTVAEIARRAGLSESTFFRHYPDKREALFLGQDVIGELMGEGIAGAPSAATPITLVTGGVMSTAAAFPADRREFVVRRRSVIAAHPELQEREERKRAGLRASIVEALLARGVDEPTAALAAHFGGLAFSRALARWALGDEEQFADAARATVHELRGAAETLVLSPPRG